MFQFLITIISILGGIIIVSVLCGTLIAGLKIIKGKSSKIDKAGQADEARVMQEIYQGLSRMEKRIASLETILFDSERKK
jgi:hypothetical protein